MQVRVKFKNTEEIWNKVVVDGDEKEMFVVDEENSNEFIVEYESDADWVAAMLRFNGMVEYQVLKE